MFGDARLGTLDWVEWIEIDSSGLAYTFPLVKQSVQRQPMFSFPQSTQQGPIDRPSIDPRLSYVSLLNDLTGGLGYQSVSPTDSLTRYFWGSLETRFKGYLTYPQRVKDTLTTPQLGVAGTSSVAATGVNVPGGAFVNHRYVYLYDRTGVSAGAYYYDATTPAGPQLLATTVPMRIVGLANVIVALATDLHLYTTVDGSTFTVRENTKQWYGLCAFDNKVWSFNRTDGTLMAAVDPTQGLFVAPATNPNGWRTMGDALQFVPGEIIVDLVVWRDNQGQDRIYVITNKRIVGFDDESGEFSEYAHHGAAPASISYHIVPQFALWPRDRQLYAVFPRASGEAARWVRQYTGTASEVGPTHAGQLSAPYFVRACALAVSNHHVFVFYNDAQGTPQQQGVLAYNEQGGWHPVFRSLNSTFQVTGGGVDGDALYVVYNGICEVVDLPDSSTAPLLIDDTHQATGGFLQTAETECGAPGVWKLGAYLYVDARLTSGAYGLPANNQLSLQLTPDGSTGAVVLASVTSAATFPAIVPLPDATQIGLPFRRLYLYLSGSKNASSDHSPRIVDIGLYYDLWREQRYAYQFAIDFTDTAWGYPRSSMGNLDRGAAIATLLGLQNTRKRFKVTFGGSGDRQVVIPAAEILVASRADDNQRGIFPVTIRDVSAPASG